MHRLTRSGVLAVGPACRWQAVATRDPLRHGRKSSAATICATSVSEWRRPNLPKRAMSISYCATDPKQTLAGWKDWRDCPADAARNAGDPIWLRSHRPAATAPWWRAIRRSSPLLIDDAGHVAGLQIETDPKARLYIRKKAFLLGLQAKSRYGSTAGPAREGQPDAGDQPVGGVYRQGTLHQDDQRPFARRRTQSVPPARSGHQEFRRRNADPHTASQGLEHCRSGAWCSLDLCPSPSADPMFALGGGRRLAACCRSKKRQFRPRATLPPARAVVYERIATGTCR